MATVNISAAMQQLYTTGKFSDLEVRCGELVAKVHKNIVCARSEWFTKAVEEGCFLEGHTGVIGFKEGSPEAVKAMLQYLYTGNYDCSDENKSPGDQMLAHLDVYAIADLIQHNDLKGLAETHFAELVKNNYKDATFPIVVGRVYAISPPGAHGQKLRQILVDVVSKHVKDVFETHGDFEAVIEQIPGFGANLSFALASGPAKTDFLSLRSMVCPRCHMTSYIAPEDTANISNCPRGCGYAPREAKFTRYQCVYDHSFFMNVKDARECLFC